MESIKIYLESIKKQFNQYKSLGEKAINQLETEKLFVSQNDNTNSIAVIIKHMHGNMLSRWTDFLSTDGEKTWRKREREFEQENMEKVMLLKMWENGEGTEKLPTNKMA